MSTDTPPAASRASLAATVVKIIDRAADTRSLFLAPDGGNPFRFVPGQFISIAIPLGDETRARPYTIASSADERGPLEICFNLVPGGRGVKWLFERRLGDVIEFKGPFGMFTMDRAPQVEAGFVAEATSIAPIRPMLERALASSPHLDSPHPGMHLIYAAADPEHILYRSEIEELARTHPHFTFETVIAPADAIYPRLTELVENRWVKADLDRSRQFYLCGVGKGVLALRDLLRGSGYERRAVHYEQW